MHENFPSYFYYRVRWNIMKYIKHFVNSYGEHTWDFTYYYHEVVPKILKHRDELSPILSSDLNGIDDREKTLNKGIIQTIYYDLENDIR